MLLNMSMKGVLVFVNLWSVKDLEATSAMLLLFPWMCVVSSGEACEICCLIASALSRSDAIVEVVVVCLFVHVTVAWLSQNMPTCECFR